MEPLGHNTEVHMATRTTSPPVTIDPQQRYSLAEGFAALRISPAQGFKEIKAGKIKVFKEGRRTFVAGAELIRRAAPPKKPMHTGSLLRAVEDAS